MIPAVILAIADEDSRAFMIRLYEQSISRILLEVQKWFSQPEDIEDAAYETVAQLVAKVALLMTLETAQRRTYILTTARHVAINKRLLRGGWQEVSFDVLEDFIPAPEGEVPDERLLREQRNARLREILKTLEPEDRVVLEERYLLQWDDAEIAKGLGIQPNSVRMRLTRAKRRLAKALLADGFYPEEWM